MIYQISVSVDQLARWLAQFAPDLPLNYMEAWNIGLLAKVHPTYCCLNYYLSSYLWFVLVRYCGLPQANFRSTRPPLECVMWEARGLQQVQSSIWKGHWPSADWDFPLHLSEVKMAGLRATPVFTFRQGPVI